MITSATTSALVLRTVSEIARRAVKFLWPRWLGRGVLTVLDGGHGAGKSALAVDLAARVSRGFIEPGSDGPGAAPAGVLFLSAQDGSRDCLVGRMPLDGRRSCGRRDRGADRGDEPGRRCPGEFLLPLRPLRPLRPLNYRTTYLGRIRRRGNPRSGGSAKKT